MEKPQPFQCVYPQTMTFISFAYRVSKQKVNLQFPLSPQNAHCWDSEMVLDIILGRLAVQEGHC